LYIHDKIIRPYIGDTLVVILIYTFIKSFFNTPVFKTALGVLLFSFIVEFSQYLKLANLVDLQHNKVAQVILGTSFSIEDLLAYVVGFATILLFEKKQ
jgi:DNA integrity scanning protein DisA with diadenylate cyclase activity